MSGLEIAVGIIACITLLAFICFCPLITSYENKKRKEMFKSVIDYYFEKKGSL